MPILSAKYGIKYKPPGNLLHRKSEVTYVYIQCIKIKENHRYINQMLNGPCSSLHFPEQFVTLLEGNTYMPYHTIHYIT